MNLEVTGVSDPTAPAQPHYDLSDWIVLFLAVGCFVVPWVYVFMHPSVETFALTLAATVTSGTVYHMVDVHDDKKPDAK